MATPLELRRVKSAVESSLLEREGVTGVGVGPKITKGQRTGELAIRVYVRKKKPKSELSEEELIPETIEGVPTDVIEREFVLHRGLGVPVAELEVHADTGTYDPLTGGISIGPCRAIGGFVYTGTLGCVVEDSATGDPMLLSNFHVFCVDDAWSVGDTMAQPSRVDTGTCPGSVVGTLQRASLGGEVDCAVANITATRGHNCEIVDIGAIAGKALPVLDEPVRKRGRTTGLTHGFVDDLALSVSIDYGNGLGEVVLTNQIGIEVDSSQSTEFGNSGDSGSVVVNASNEIIGLYFAGTEDGSYGVANRIDPVLTALNVQLCSPSVDPPWTTVWDDIEPPTLIWRDTSPWTDIGATAPWLDPARTLPWFDAGGFTANKAFDDVKTDFYDTLMETVQEHVNTIQEHGTWQENIPFDPSQPWQNPPVPGGWGPSSRIRGRQARSGTGGAAPFALSTPHRARAARVFESGARGGRAAAGFDLDEEIARVEEYLRELRRRRGPQ
ncbi:MAG TPA: hypothetical protein VF167_14940 [Longimicrobiaceae bacterium]